MNHINVMCASRWKWLTFVPTVKYAPHWYSSPALCCAQVGVRSKPFCFHAGTTRWSDNQSFLCVYNSVPFVFHWIDNFFLSELFLMTHTLKLHCFVDTTTISAPGNTNNLVLCCDNMRILFGVFNASVLWRCYWVVRVVSLITLNEDRGI